MQSFEHHCSQWIFAEWILSCHPALQWIIDWLCLRRTGHLIVEEVHPVRCRTNAGLRRHWWRSRIRNRARRCRRKATQSSAYRLDVPVGSLAAARCRPTPYQSAWRSLPRAEYRLIAFAQASAIAEIRRLALVVEAVTRWRHPDLRAASGLPYLATASFHSSVCRSGER